MKLDDEKFRERRISGETVFQGRLLHVLRDRIELPDGRQSTREYIRHPGAAAIVVLRDGKILLERQWRYPLGRAFWEIPAGKLDAGEEPLECAKRELLEEAGISATDWVGLGTMCPGIGDSDETIWIYAARGLFQGERHLDEGEFLDLVWVPFDEAVRMVLESEIVDSKTIAAIYRTEKNLSRLR